MAPLRSLVAATLLLLSAANAHFILNNPVSLEGGSIDEDKEGNAPCGADLPDLSKKTTNDFHVDGDFVSVRLGHPQGNWLIRATLDGKASGNWSQLFPIVTQSGLGDFCEPIVTAPKEWVGKTGVIGVAVKAPDGILYQCAVVNFVAGTNTPGDSCKNGSSVTGSFSSDSALSALVGNPSSNPASSTSATPSSSPSPSSPAGSAASALAANGFPLGSILVTVAMVLAGTAML